MEVTLYKATSKAHKSEWEGDVVAAHLDGVRTELAKKAFRLYVIASAKLDAHKALGHASGSSHPKITLSRGKRLDYYIMLEADSLEAAMGIEYGHGEEGPAGKRKWVTGASRGLHIIQDIVEGA